MSAEGHTSTAATLPVAQADVTGLTAALGAKSATGHTHAESDVTNLTTDLAAKAPLAAPSFTGGVTIAGGVTVSAGIGRLIDVAMTADQTINNSTTLVDAGTGQTVLQAALEASGVYNVSGLIIYSSSTTADLKLGWIGLTTPTVHWTGGGLTSGAAAASASINLGYDQYTDSQIVGGIGVGTKLIAMVTGRVIVGAAGTLKLQVAQGALDATNTVVYTGSALTFRRVA